MQLGRDCGQSRQRSVDCEGCECLSCRFHSAAEEIVVGYDIVPLIVKAESVCRAGFTMQLGRDCGWLQHCSVDCEGCECLSCRFHNAAEEIVVGYDIVPPVSDSVQLSVDEYRSRLYEV